MAHEPVETGGDYPLAAGILNARHAREVGIGRYNPEDECTGCGLANPGGHREGQGNRRPASVADAAEGDDKLDTIARQKAGRARLSLAE